MSSSFLQVFETQGTPTKKRKRLGQHVDLRRKDSRLQDLITNRALADVSPDQENTKRMNTPSPSVYKRSEKNQVSAITLLSMVYYDADSLTDRFDSANILHLFL